MLKNKFIVRKSKKAKRSILYISLLFFVLDATFIVINYHSAREALYKNLTDKALISTANFNTTVQMTYRSMQLMSDFISHDNELNQLFLRGKKAIDMHNEMGDRIAAEIRSELLQQVKPAWDQLTSKFDVRQLHYHLGPGSLSFLRVHKPTKFGDRMDNLRFTVVDTNATEKGHTGFETGRIYSGLRSVSPVWCYDNEQGQSVYVGAVEVGTSFKQILPMFPQNYATEVVVLLTKEHVENKMWPQFIAQYFAEHTDMNYYLEAASSDIAANLVNELLKVSPINDDYKTQNVELVEINDAQLAMYYFPLRDYRGDQDPNLKPVGLVLLWSDVSDLFTAFKKSVWINIVYAVCGFVFLEAVLLWFFNREFRLLVAEKEATIDGLTGFYNRRYFDKTLNHEMLGASRSNSALALIMCDIDYFKQYNDTYGHVAGDGCLQQVAAVMAHVLKRGNDWIARYGGEEFVIVLPGTELDGAYLVAERIRVAVEDANIPHRTSKVGPRVTISVGVACTVEKGCTCNSGLINCADMKLYKAKESGRNAVFAAPRSPT